MQSEGFMDNTYSEDEMTREIEVSLRDVSISSIKTQDSIENNSMIINFDEEERKETGDETLRISGAPTNYTNLPPFLSLKETQQAIVSSMASPRIRLVINPLHEVLRRLHKISEDFQTWKKYN
jgi:hypothetical protein